MVIPTVYNLQIAFDRFKETLHLSVMSSWNWINKDCSNNWGTGEGGCSFGLFAVFCLNVEDKHKELSHKPVLGNFSTSVSLHSLIIDRQNHPNNVLFSTLTV